MAIHKLRCLLDGFKIAGVFDDFRWARHVVGSVDKIDAIWGHDGYALLQIQAGAFQCSQSPMPSAEPCQ
jgi:hypothetical protein